MQKLLFVSVYDLVIRSRIFFLFEWAAARELCCSARSVKYRIAMARKARRTRHLSSPFARLTPTIPSFLDPVSFSRTSGCLIKRNFSFSLVKHKNGKRTIVDVRIYYAGSAY